MGDGEAPGRRDPHAVFRAVPGPNFFSNLSSLHASSSSSSSSSSSLLLLSQPTGSLGPDGRPLPLEPLGEQAGAWEDGKIVPPHLHPLCQVPLMSHSQRKRSRARKNKTTKLLDCFTCFHHSLFSIGVFVFGAAARGDCAGSGTDPLLSSPRAQTSKDVGERARQGGTEFLLLVSSD